MKTKTLLFLSLFIGLSLLWYCVPPNDCGEHPFNTYRAFNSIRSSLNIYRKITPLNSFDTVSSSNIIYFNLNIDVIESKDPTGCLKQSKNFRNPFELYASEPCPTPYINYTNSVEDITVITLHDINDSIKAMDTVNQYLNYIYLNLGDTIYEKVSLAFINTIENHALSHYNLLIDSLFIQPNTTIEFKTYLELSDKIDSSISPRIFIQN